MDEPDTKAAPAGPAQGDVDEFAGIRSPRTRHPALAAGAVLLALFLVFHERRDVSYALSSSAAIDLGEARTLFQPGAAAPPTNRTVRVAGVPDRESALEIDTKGSWTFSQLFRVLGTGSRLFVHRPDDPVPRERAERDVFVGRLLPLSDLSFESAIRSYFAGHVSATHFFRKEDLLAAAGKPGATLRDLGGDEVALGQNDVVAIDVARAGELLITLPAKLVAWRPGPAPQPELPAAFQRYGATVLEVTGRAGGDVTVRAAFPPDRRDVAIEALADLDRRVVIRPARETYKTRFADIGAGENALRLKDGAGRAVSAPLADVETIRTLAAVEIPRRSYILIEGDEPGRHALTLLVCAALLGFAAISLLGLRQGLRR